MGGDVGPRRTDHAPRLERASTGGRCSFCGRALDGAELIVASSGAVAICAVCANRSALILRGAPHGDPRRRRPPLHQRLRQAVRGWPRAARAALLLAGSTPWVRAPGRLFRHPAVFAATAASMLVLVVAAASGPLFLASAQTAALHHAVSAGCPQTSQPALNNGQTTSAQFAHDAPLIGEVVMQGGLPRPYAVAHGTAVLPGKPAGTGKLTIYRRAGALDHVRLLTPRGRAGLWIPQSFATAAGIRPGATMPLTDVPGDRPIRVPIAGIYADLAPGVAPPALPRYWCSWSTLIEPSLTKRPPPLAITDQATLRAIPISVSASVFVPTPTGRQSVDAAAAAQQRITEAADRLPDSDVYDYRPGTSLPHAIGKARTIGNSLWGIAVWIAAAGSCVALLLVVGAAVFWTRRRHRELRLLAVRGAGPVALAGRAILELAPAVAAGAIGGLYAMVALVRVAAPDGTVAPDARHGAWSAALWASAGALATIAAVAATSRPMGTERPRHRMRSRPWELSLLVAAGVIYYLVHRSGAVHVVSGIVRINPLVVAFPLVAAAGVSVLLARVAALTLRRFATAQTRGVVLYLAMRRITGTPAIAVGLAIAVALPCTVLTYAVSLTGSARAGIQQKYQTYVGAPHALATLAPPGSRIDTRGHGTVVSVIGSDRVSAGGHQVAVLGVDPATFLRFAYHTPGAAAAVRKLRSTGHSVPAIAVNADGAHIHTLSLRSTTLRIHVVDRLSIFPGLRNGYQPMLVVARSALHQIDPYVNREEEIWTTDADLAACIAVLGHDHVGVQYRNSPASFIGGTGLLPLTWIFGYLRALGVLIGLVALAGLVFAVTARLRRDMISYIALRRMGLRRGDHRRSLVVELGVTVLSGWVGGAALAVGAFWIVHGALDVNPSFPPPAPLRLPVATLAETFGVALCGAVTAAIVMQRRLDHADAALVLRSE